MDAEARIKFVLGTQFVEIEYLKDTVTNLRLENEKLKISLSERDETIKRLEQEVA